MTTMLRFVSSVAAGAITWMVAFYALAISLGAIWSAYAQHGRTFFSESVFTFTAPMACLNLLFWVLADMAAGAVAFQLGRTRVPVWILAGSIESYVTTMHVLLYWPRFPWWYNIGVVIPAIPAVLMGARLSVSGREQP